MKNDLQNDYDIYREPDFLKDVIFLGIHRIDDIYAIYAAIMPYFNEIMNLLTITFFKPVFGIKLFYHFTTNFHEIMVNSIITLFSISGIVANATRTASIYTKTKGLLVGISFTVISFLIPNMFMQDVIKYFKGNYLLKFFIGLILIYILDVIIHLIIHLYRVYMLKDSREDLKDDIRDVDSIKNKERNINELYIDKSLVY